MEEIVVLQDPRCEHICLVNSFSIQAVLPVDLGTIPITAMIYVFTNTGNTFSTYSSSSEDNSGDVWDILGPRDCSKDGLWQMYQVNVALDHEKNSSNHVEQRK